MFTMFERVTDSKTLYQKINNSLLINSSELSSPSYKFAGLYAIFKDDVCYYVGQSQNLASRITQHLTGKYKNADSVYMFMPTHNSFSDFYERDKDARRSILEINELFLISFFKPIENILIPPDDFNLPENKRFKCFLPDNFDGLTVQEFCYEQLSQKITISEDKLTVSTGSAPHLEFTPALDHYVNYIIEVTANLGSKVAIREFCHGQS